MTILYVLIFMIILLGFSFNFYEEKTSSVIANFAKYFTQPNYNINVSLYIKYYLLLIFVLSIIQELVFLFIYKAFNKDMRKIAHKSKTFLCYSIIISILIMEIAISVALKEYWLMLVGIISFIFLVVCYFIHIFVSKLINNVQSYVGMLYNIHI